MQPADAWTDELESDLDAPARQRLTERAHGRGWRVELLPAPQGQDWNDVLIAGAATRSKEGAQ